MRYRVFLDTNILISGIFFDGNESKILDIPEIDLITSEDCIDELLRVTRKKRSVERQNLNRIPFRDKEDEIIYCHLP
jgi:predicted nucleic acid-binding protein